MLIYSYINTSGNWKNAKFCGNTTPAGRSVFTQFRVFPIFTSVNITVYQYGKNVLYFFYNIAQRTLTEEWREIFRVDVIYINTALSQSAFRIYKCYIIIIDILWSCYGYRSSSCCIHIHLFPCLFRCVKNLCYPNVMKICLHLKEFHWI